MSDNTTDNNTTAVCRTLKISQADAAELVRLRAEGNQISIEAVTVGTSECTLEVVVRPIPKVTVGTGGGAYAASFGRTF